MPPNLEENLRRARPYMERFSTGVQGHFIGGRICAGESGKTFSNHCPADGALINRVAAGSAADVDVACVAARDAFPG
ncbi:MAG: 5-carboxymethyl-2-hydroxymuconate semialdehyde dehydrogenase, partial [Gammaproteobacteria bacterium]|nr:5-carboxymethyl-2-hydroxymuconate semialdehyde dehydrogenase [Gammaproteobacteria bacterium]